MKWEIQFLLNRNISRNLAVRCHFGDEGKNHFLIWNFDLKCTHSTRYNFNRKMSKKTALKSHGKVQTNFRQKYHTHASLILMISAGIENRWEYMKNTRFMQK